jgi:hypothetical protein
MLTWTEGRRPLDHVQLKVGFPLLNFVKSVGLASESHCSGGSLLDDNANEGTASSLRPRFREPYPSWSFMHIFTIGVAVFLKQEVFFRR